MPKPSCALAAEPADEHRCVRRGVGVVEESPEPAEVRRRLLVEHDADGGVLGARVAPPRGLQLERPTVELYNFATAWRTGGYWSPKVVNLGDGGPPPSLLQVKSALAGFGLL